MVQGETGVQGVSHGMSKSMVAGSLACYVFGKDAPTQPITPNSPLGLKSLEFISMCSCPPDPGLSYLFVGLLFLCQVP